MAFWKIPTTLLLFLFLFPFYGKSQSIDKNEYVQYRVEIEDGQYHIEYRFQDQFYNYQNYTLALPVRETGQMIEKFGIPRWMFEPYADTEVNRQYRKQIMEEGLFVLKGDVIEVDKSAVISYYAEHFGKPIAEMIVSSLSDYGSDNRRNRIEFALRFIQDIPYGVPDFHDRDRHYGGVHVPPGLLVEGYGDCDSKVLLFVSILIYLVPAENILFLNQKEHVLAAIRGEPEKGLTFVRYQGEPYLIAESAGPGKRLLGQKGNYYKERFSIETLSIQPPDVIPFRTSSTLAAKPFIPESIEENMLFLRNESAKDLTFEISTDNRRWETVQLRAHHSGKYVFKRKTEVFLKVNVNPRKSIVYQILTGKIYEVQWNSRKQKWEISG
jgi:hypothetical protein